MGKKGKYRNQAEQDQQPKKKKMMITEQHLMDKTHMDSTQYIPFLPSDSLYPSNRPDPRVLRIITRDLNYLLYSDFKTFWATLLYNPSLKICLCSCLQNLHRMQLNMYRTKPQQEEQKAYQNHKFTDYFQLTQALFKTVLMVYFRITHPFQENKQLTELYKLPEQVNNKYILDITRVIEMIQIYGKSNPEILSALIKGYIKYYGGESAQKNNMHNFNQFYNDFVKDIMSQSIQKLSRVPNTIKKTSDREQFGIEYSYNRTTVGQLSPGQQELKKKIVLLTQIISFYDMINNIQQYFPEICSDYIRSNETIHQISENIFIEIQIAYKTWNNHGMGHYIYPYMNKIILQIRDYFINFLKICEGLFIKRSTKSSVMGSYVKCIDRMIQFYGRRNSLGKKQMLNKRYMELYQQIIKEYKIDDFLTAIYVDQIQNGTHGINVEYLVDFKFAIEEILVKLNGLPQPPHQPNQNDQIQTQIDGMQQNAQYNQQPMRKYSNISNTSKMGENQAQTKKSQQNLDKLEMLISKKDRQQNYYQKLYSQYRTKITIQYEDQYDDLADFEKRPMFEDDANQRQGSSDASSQFDSNQQKLHLVKSVSNVSRARVYGKDKNEKSKLQKVMHEHQQKQHHYQHKGIHGTKNDHGEQKQSVRDSTYHSKRYKKKDQPKFQKVKKQQAQQIIKQYGNNDQNKYTKNSGEQQKPNKKNYIAKEENKGKCNEYNDEQCYQECRVKKEEETTEDKQERNRGNYNNNRGGKKYQNNARKQGNKNKYKAKFVSKDD